MSRIYNFHVLSGWFSCFIFVRRTLIVETKAARALPPVKEAATARWPWFCWYCGAGVLAHNACVLSMLYYCWCYCMLFLKASLIVCWEQIMIHQIHSGMMHLHIGEVLNRRYGTPLPLTWFEIRWRHIRNMEGKVGLHHSMSNTTVIHTRWDRR